MNRGISGVFTIPFNRHRRESGAAMVEMAVVLPLLVILLFGIWTTARAFNVKNTMDHAVREAARYGATVDPWDASTSWTSVRGVADTELTAAAINPMAISTFCIEKIDEGAAGCPDGGGTDTVTGAPRDQIVVRLEYADYPLDFIFFSVPVDLTATAIARYES